ncbi:hypothetical protein F4804DRAFT_335656 [Jackrogersella minutella]|nr:hypothetical protein F4804DRAFT_335656 [Jackrogersella minutella]
MQFKFFALTFLAATATADNLSKYIDDFPPCALPCLAKSANNQGCNTTDFGCICTNKKPVLVELGGCMSDYCNTLLNGAAASKVSSLCKRWDKDPSPTEITAATSDLESKVAAASATVTPKNAAGALVPGLMMAGAAAAAAASWFI